MQNTKKDKSGVWKGIVPINFKGKIADSKTGEAIGLFSVCEIVNGKPAKGQLESEGKTIDLGLQTVESKRGSYEFTLYIATLNGQTYIRDSKPIRVIGPASEAITIQLSADGYERKNINIPKNEILTKEYNNIDISLDPILK